MSSTQVVNFTVGNSEYGPSAIQFPQSVVVNLDQTIRPPQLSGLVSYYYSNCNVTNAAITENITI